MRTKEQFEMAAHLSIAIHPDLHRRIGDEAEAQNMTMNEYIAKVMADHFEEPQLARIPRKRLGRPRKDLATSSRK